MKGGILASAVLKEARDKYEQEQTRDRGGVRSEDASGVGVYIPIQAGRYNSSIRSEEEGEKMKVVYECSKTCSFCVLVQELLRSDDLSQRDWQTFRHHLKLEHGWVEGELTV
jgi:hypothetical protein